jgi:hypothetical protein
VWFQRLDGEQAHAVAASVIGGARRASWMIARKTGGIGLDMPAGYARLY